jgi:parallel beta-helix repeat protein
MDASIESAQDGSYEGNKIVNSGLGIFLAICSSIVLIGSNYKKV